MIRELLIEDYNKVIDLWNNIEGIGLNDDDSKESIERFLLRNPGLSFLFEENDKIVGAVLCGHDGRRGYIHHLAVHENCRGRKIGTQLFEENQISRHFWKSTDWKKRDDLLVYSKYCDRAYEV